MSEAEVHDSLEATQLAQGQYQVVENPNIATHDEQVQTLLQIDAKCDELQKEQKLTEALQYMEKSLLLRGHIFGLDSIEVFHACKSVGELCNYIAMATLQDDESTPESEDAKKARYAEAFRLLQKAEILTERHPILRAATFNNMACYYRKIGKLRTALSFVEKAIQIENKFPQSPKAADTHLNACTILSELHRHEAAFAHAHTALQLLLLELFGPEAQARIAEMKRRAEDGEEGPEGNENLTRSGHPIDRMAVLVIAYHNLAVQQEYLRKYEDALVSYEKAYKVAAGNLEDHPLVAKMNTSLEEARAKLQPRIEKHKSLRSTQKALQQRGPSSRPRPLTKTELQQLRASLGLDGSGGSGEGGENEGGDE